MTLENQLYVHFTLPRGQQMGPPLQWPKNSKQSWFFGVLNVSHSRVTSKTVPISQ